LQATEKQASPIVLTAYLQSTREFAGAIGKHRRLLFALARRDLREEYVDHGLSVVWTVVQPLLIMAVYVFAFTYIFPTRVDPPGGFPTNATVYLLAGLTPWMILTQIMGKSLASIVANSNVVKQMAFPLELLPTKTMASPLFFGAVAVSFVVLYTCWVTGGSALPVLIWGVPLLIAISLVMFTGIALTLASFEVFLRDTKEFVSMFTTIGFFTHPILYLPNAIPEVVRPVLYLSPLTYFLMCWQDIFFYGGIVRGWAWVVTLVFSVVIFVFGARVFMASKQHFGDFL